ncbi:hypothetical protein PIB30_083250 [Stylosanthes scabra]|uniref:Uncharacterized protein n=1 Tax=Stylosanthes scabra TaxID=79078 RepID=A0ABU6QRR7_9FABA|nr:hypothetical protein [Stylosanthes scabra]
MCVQVFQAFNRQSSKKKWLKRARGTRRSQRKPRRPILDPVCTHPRAYAYAPIALGGTPRDENEADAYAPKALVRTHRGILESINRGGHDHFEGSLHIISSLVFQRVVTLCLGYELKCADDLSCRSLRETDGRNIVNSDAVNAMPLPTAWGP